LSTKDAGSHKMEIVAGSARDCIRSSPARVTAIVSAPAAGQLIRTLGRSRVNPQHLRVH
jgi:hypothetical protein